MHSWSRISDQQIEIEWCDNKDAAAAELASNYFLCDVLCVLLACKLSESRDGITYFYHHQSGNNICYMDGHWIELE